MTASPGDGEASPVPVPVWLPRAATAVSGLGLAVAAYLTVAHYTTPALLACSDRGAINCAAVTTSPESTLAGVPVAVLGLAFFAAMVGLNLPRVWRMGGRPGAGLALLRLVGAVTGMGFALYLVATELLVIGAICLYCTAAHVLAFALLVLVSAGTAERGIGPLDARPVDTGPPHAGRLDTVPADRDGTSSGPAAQQSFALGLVEAAPNAVGLPDP